MYNERNTLTSMHKIVTEPISASAPQINFVVYCVQASVVTAGDNEGRQKAR